MWTPACCHRPLVPRCAEHTDEEGRSKDVGIIGLLVVLILIVLLLRLI